MAEYPNKDALTEALDVYVDAMRPFVHRCMRRIRGTTAGEAIAGALNDRAREHFRDRLARGESVEGAIDANDIPHVVNRRWDEFGPEFGNDRSVINLLWVIRDARNRAAHRGERDTDVRDAQAFLTHVADVLRRIGRAEAATRVDAIRAGLDAAGDASEPPAPPEAAPPAAATRRNGGRLGLKPWREAARPNSDVMEGTFREAEFAADLQQVYDGRAASEYGNPVAFFERTYVTPGMRTLLDNALRRLAGGGGDPVIQARTGFGGGKTHSLIALYHLAAHTAAVTGSGDAALAEARALAEEAGLGAAEAAARVAVLDCTWLSPTSAAVTEPGGDPRNTLWGEMAWQLGGQDGYDLVGAAARGGAAPGGAELDALLAHAGPCVILIDELVAYARNVREGRDSVYTFVDNLTRAVRRSERAVLVVTLPEHAAEAGGEDGAEALGHIEAVLDNILGRIEAIWQPLETSEAFEVVRRRLFGNGVDEDARDRTCRAFADMYRRGGREYPPHAREQRYLERMKQCYPIHPEVFDRLYEGWSSIPRFQRTRGVLRLLANCVSRLYSRGDASPLILPGHLPLADPAVGGEFLPLLPGQWGPVLSEADSEGSRADLIDGENQRFREVGAARRIARAVFLGSAPSGAVRGIDARSVRLAAVEPGHGAAAYNEALARMSGNLYYLYDDGQSPAARRYWFHAEENLNKVAADRIGEIAEREVASAIEEELREAAGRRADAAVCPADSAAVPDDGALRLVVLPPSAPLPSRAAETETARAEAVARDMLLQRGAAPRQHRNALLFLAARNDELRALRGSVRSWLAWRSIASGPARIEGLEGERAAQARANVERARAAVEDGLVRAWRWTLAPYQPDPRSSEYGFAHHETAAAATGEIAAAAFDRLAREEALVDEMAPRALASLLGQHLWRGDAYHVPLPELRSMFTRHVWLPRLRGPDVLAECVRAGVENGSFGWAEAYDPEASRYLGLRFGQPLAAGPDAASGLLVEPEMAQLQREEEAAAAPGAAPPPAARSGARVAEASPDAGGAPAAPAPPRGPRRITATAAMSADISLDEVSRLRDEIVRTLRDDGAEIEIAVTVTARKPDGFSEHAARAARENAVQLGLDLEIEEG